MTLGPETQKAIARFVGREEDLNENLREYLYPTGAVQIKNPRKFFVSDSGNHRIRTEEGLLYVVSPGWMAIRIEDDKKDWDF